MLVVFDLMHFTSSKFRALYQELPGEVQAVADKSYRLLKDNPCHYTKTRIRMPHTHDL